MATYYPSITDDQAALIRNAPAVLRRLHRPRARTRS